ncbi:MAG: glycosyltransferase N-terminal domain-containing protein, partial [Chlamydiota bacterium]
KISERSLRRFNILPWVMAPLFQLIDLICPQNEDYKDRFMRLGIPPDHLYVTGNLKLDDASTNLSEKAVGEWKKKLGLHKDDFLLVIGSTHHPEEKQLIHVLKKVWKKCPGLKVALAPRHPERFKTVASYLESIKMPFATYSAEEQFNKQTNLMLFDEMGILRELYQVGDMAIVAGSYTDKVGGHHLLEPSLYGKPVLFGPHTQSQSEMAFMMKKAEAGKQVSLDELGEAIVDLISHPEKRKKMGAAGIKMFAEAKGATERTWQLLRVMISQILWEKEEGHL